MHGFSLVDSAECLCVSVYLCQIHSEVILLQITKDYLMEKPIGPQGLYYEYTHRFLRAVL